MKWWAYGYECGAISNERLVAKDVTSKMTDVKKIIFQNENGRNLVFLSAWYCKV
jgi:hypothetical protein